MSVYGGSSKTKQGLRVGALILLAVVSLSVAVYALAVKPDHDGRPPLIIQELFVNKPKL